MEVTVDRKLVSLISSLEMDINDAIDEGLMLWLKTKITVCPITKEFCKSPNTPCNDCTSI